MPFVFWRDINKIRNLKDESPGFTKTLFFPNKQALTEYQQGAAGGSQTSYQVQTKETLRGHEENHFNYIERQ